MQLELTVAAGSVLALPHTVLTHKVLERKVLEHKVLVHRVLVRMGKVVMGPRRTFGELGQPKRLNSLLKTNNLLA